MPPSNLLKSIRHFQDALTPNHLGVHAYAPLAKLEIRVFDALRGTTVTPDGQSFAKLTWRVVVPVVARRPRQGVSPAHLSRKAVLK